MFKRKNIKFILLSIAIIYIFIFSDIGIISKIKLDQKVDQYQVRLEELIQENEKLKLQMNQLKNDYNYIADLARKLGYANKGEKIYRFFQEEIKTNKIKTNIKPAPIEFKIKDYLIYMLTFFAVLLIYIILIINSKTNKKEN